ncbi:PBP1A family penicillin-binding protein [Sphingomonas sp. MAHUQ-71]|uniref:peptidoglycan glycosyltransferase n=2 Tax=Sphingomonas oryzagri TaxID=3042314 RepID=A0ABT6N4N5_9SPHN|nr:PBP1A family penicillin-binding protein [Sphingomonas oryzagri]MDH7639874.1 PBP1A family penicillin-binding protein [Sphingomonas oryzagri]
MGGDPFGQPTAPMKPRRRRFWWLRWAISGVLLLFMAAVAWLAVTAPLSKSLQPIAPPSIALTDSNGRMFARRGAVTDRPVDVTKLPPHVWQAFVAIEDRRFYHHWAIDPHGIARAAWHNLRAGHVREGGSTITQQLSKLVFLNSDRTAGRKIREVMVAFWLEAWLSKDQILSRYLSNVYFGDNVYGLRAAAHHYFGKQPEDLSVSESAMLAGLMKAPSKLAPSTNLAGAQAREMLVVAAMKDAGFIDAATAAKAHPARLHLRPVPAEIGGSYFADWVLPAARDQAGGGYEQQSVQTTLDSRLQRAAEAAAAQVGSRGQVAIVAMKPDGRVVAMVGGSKYEDSGFNRATQARRQPGSTFKLFVYLAALRAGMTPDSKVEDKPITINGWSPSNADHRYQGMITLRQAFARSSNVAAVRLAQKVGPDAVVKAARDLGITSPLNADPSLALGTSGITLLELTRAYAAVAGNAYPVTPHGLPDPPPGWIDRFWDHKSHFPSDQHDELLDLLSATVKQGTAKAAALNTQVFGKTGTTQDNRDAIFVGFADGLVTAVWVGRDDNKPIPGLAGGGLPARIWRSFMAQATGARPLGQKLPVVVDPDAVSASGNFTLGNMDFGLDLDEGGLHLRAKPHEGEAPPAEPEDGGDAEGNE